MEFKFGQRSKEQLGSCHPDIITVLSHCIRIVDFSVLEGVRTPERQMQLFIQHRTTLDGTTGHQSKHQPKEHGWSHAVDIAPYPIDFSDEATARARFYFLQGIVKGVSELLYTNGVIKHRIRQGCDWDGDMDFTDQHFDDLPHLELIEK